jgi:hypothetical protein
LSAATKRPQFRPAYWAHYLQVTDDHFKQASIAEAVQNPSQQASESVGTDKKNELVVV